MKIDVSLYRNQKHTDMTKTTTNTIEQRFVDYCWRLGFTPKTIQANGNAFLVQTDTNVSQDVKKGFTNTFTGSIDGKFWMRLAYVDLHNELITGHNRETSNGWFRNHEIPKY